MVATPHPSGGCLTPSPQGEGFLLVSLHKIIFVFGFCRNGFSKGELAFSLPLEGKGDRYAVDEV